MFCSSGGIDKYLRLLELQFGFIVVTCRQKSCSPSFSHQVMPVYCHACKVRVIERSRTRKSQIIQYPKLAYALNSKNERNANPNAT